MKEKKSKKDKKKSKKDTKETKETAECAFTTKATKVLTKKLGRTPTDKELAKKVKKLKEKASAE